MLIALAVLVTIGAFLLGITIAWQAKGYVEDYIENAAYAKSVTHPEMLDEDGNITVSYTHLTLPTSDLV